MKPSDKETARKQMNLLGGTAKPFLFIINFDMTKNYVVPIEKVNANVLLYDIEGFSNTNDLPQGRKPEYFRKFPVVKKYYNMAFDIVMKEILAGNTYLLNLTFPTMIQTNLSLKELFFSSSAPYKLWFNKRFIVFSPESFVRINGNIISSYPMKGTIDASIPGAEQIILSDAKETAEHNTVVDLIRNDLSLVAKNVQVQRFRYIDRIKTNCKDLLQVSSEITGELDKEHNSRLGDIFFTLLPAGSVTGAPKRKTIEILSRAEVFERGYYTGVFGYFDGTNLNSAVMIRYIEQIDDGNLIYRSGGGITAFSDPEKEYHELIDKVYVPLV
jgi:para-aminobenzoate synthetase component I